MRSPSYIVSVQPALPRAIAAVRARVPKGSVAAVFGTYLDQVYAAAGNDTIPLDGQNIFVYHGVEGSPNELDVDFGVGVRAPFSAVGGVRYTEVPSGQVATTTHVGDYALGAANEAIIAWCNAHDLRLAGPSWEVYGHSSPDKPPRTDIYYLLAP